MKTFTKIMLATALATPGFLVSALPAQAQVAGVAVADPDAAIANSKVWANAQTQIATTYKVQLDAAKARSDVIAKELAPMYKTFDTNNDDQLTPAEIQAARTANSPVLKQVEAKEKAANDEIARMTLQPTRARQYAAEQISGKINDAIKNVVAQRKVSLLLRPASAFFADPSADITPAITTELDRLMPTASITPPATWQPGQQQAAPAAAAAAPAAAPSKAPAQSR